MFEYMEYNIAPWGYEIPLFMFLIGTAGMVFVLASAPNVFGAPGKVFAPSQRMLSIVSLVLLLVVTILLIADLGQPARFLYPIIYFHWTSPVSWGATFLPLFALCILGFLYALHVKNAGLLRLTGILGSLLALAMPLYTGLDLMVHQSRELWSNPTIPVLFVILSITSGATVVALLLQFRGGLSAELTRILRNVLFFSVSVTLALFLAEWAVMLFGSEEQQQAWGIINSEYGLRFWGLTFVVGTLIPLGILVAMVEIPALTKSTALLMVAGVLASVGAYTFREVLIYAGQLTQIYY